MERATSGVTAVVGVTPEGRRRSIDAVPSPPSSAGSQMLLLKPNWVAVVRMLSTLQGRVTALAGQPAAVLAGPAVGLSTPRLRPCPCAWLEPHALASRMR